MTAVVDRDRVYEPEQLAQLGRDLVKARGGKKLDPFEKSSLKRWARQGLSARIRQMPASVGGGLTCWPTDLTTSPSPSRVGKKRTTAREAMAFLRGEQDYRVSVGVRFDKTDLDLLRAAALMSKVGDDMFDHAVKAVERDTYLVVQVMSVDELKEIIARFRDAGIVHVTLDTLRVGETKPVRV